MRIGLLIKYYHEMRFEKKIASKLDLKHFYEHNA